MALPKAYLTSTKNLAAILNAIKSGQAPEKFTQRFLETLGFKSAADRLIIGVLKQLDFLDSEGKPKDRYFRFLDQSQSEIVLAEAIRDAYSDLFTIRRDAQSFSNTEVINKAKTLSQGQMSDSVLKKFALTFSALCGQADFSKSSKETEKPAAIQEDAVSEKTKAEEPPQLVSSDVREKLTLGGLHYNIQIILPPSRDPKVYDALFKSLKEHLID
ncbi:DUF5343 domain-containing protein [Roseobacter sp. A03A-229]